MRPYFYDRLSVVDNSFLAIEGATTHQHVAGATVFDAAPLARADGGLEIDRIRAYIESRLPLIPRYRQKLVGVPFGTRHVWVDDEHFNLDYHVRHTSLPRPGTLRQLKRLSARIVSQQLDRAKPLWEIWIVEGLEGGDRWSMVAKTHHCMIDGVSGVDLMAVLLSPDAAIPRVEPTRWIPRTPPSQFQLLRDELCRRVRQPLELWHDLATPLLSPGTFVAGVREQLEAVGEALGAASERASETPINRPIGPHRRFDWAMMELADVKAVKNKLGGTVNDVVLTTVAGALRRFLERRCVNVDVLRLRASVPVSLRTGEQQGTLGNQIALWMTELPVAERDPVLRLAKVSATTARLKHSRQAMGAQVLAAVSEWTSSTLLSVAVRLTTRSRPFNLVVTNVPGPQMPLYMLGSQLREFYPMLALLENQGLGVALFSYDGHLCWGFIADWELVPDLHDFVLDIECAFEELKATANAQDG